MAVAFGTCVCDKLFTADPIKLEELSESFKKSVRAGSANPKALTNVRVSGLAAVKMLMHSMRGIDEGIASEQGKPVEVMGVLFGYRDTSTPSTIVVIDAFPVKCKGGPHSAVMDPDTASYMAALGESLEATRPNGKICGWYHSHPFEPLPEKHHCWFSSTDVQNQNQWQIMTERHGDPFIGIVVDPQTSLLKRKIHMSAFRNFPQGYKGDNPNECPDGKTDHDDNSRKLRWGAAWRSYYELKMSFFTSSTNAKLLSVLSRKYLWISELSQSDANDPQHRARFPTRVQSAANQCQHASRFVRQGASLSLGGGGRGGRGGGGGGGGNNQDNQDKGDKWTDESSDSSEAEGPGAKAPPTPEEKEDNKIKALGINRAELDSLKHTFSMFDTEMKGHINTRDMEEFLVAFGQRLNDRDLECMFRRMTNGHSTKLMTKEQFCVMMHNSVRRTDAPYKTFFDKVLDADGDGTITEEELKKSAKLLVRHIMRACLICSSRDPYVRVRSTSTFHFHSTTPEN